MIKRNDIKTLENIEIHKLQHYLDINNNKIYY